MKNGPTLICCLIDYFSSFFAFASAPFGKWLELRPLSHLPCAKSLWLWCLYTICMNYHDDDGQQTAEIWTEATSIDAKAKPKISIKFSRWFCMEDYSSQYWGNCEWCKAKLVALQNRHDDVTWSDTKGLSEAATPGAGAKLPEKEKMLLTWA